MRILQLASIEIVYVNLLECRVNLDTALIFFVNLFHPRVECYFYRVYRASLAFLLVVDESDLCIACISLN